jgi:undecaprenyl-diphosphatase
MRGRLMRIDRRILLAFLLIALVLFLFLRLASEVAEGETFALDRSIMIALRSDNLADPVGPAWLELAMVQLTSLGSGAVLWLVTVLSGGYLLAARKPASAAFLFVSIAAGMALNAVLKVQFLRPRPALVTHLVQVQTTSFPSGHAMNSAIVYLTLGGLLARSQTSRAVRIYLLSVALGLTVMVGISRIYLGVHWPSDVLAGWSVGSAWALGSSLLARAMQPATSG